VGRAWTDFNAYAASSGRRAGWIGEGNELMFAKFRPACQEMCRNEGWVFRDGNGPEQGSFVRVNELINDPGKSLRSAAGNEIDKS
jgi:hypothetical protein